MKLFLHTSLVLFVSFVLASDTVDATTVQNEISVHASTGGNSSAGQATESEARTSVFVETTVDGEVVQRAQEEKVGVQGESVEIKKQMEYKNDGVEVEVEAEVSVEIQEEVEQNQEEQESKEEIPLMASIVGFFRKIFSWFLA